MLAASDNYEVLINTKADSSGVDNITKKFGDMADGFSGGMKKVAVGLAVVGAGLTAYAKNATDFTENYVKTAKNLGRQIGTTTEEASRLTAAFSRMGLESDQVQGMFGIFSKKIVAATESTDKDRLAHEKLQISYDKTRKEIDGVNKEIKLHGDKSGDLSLKLKELNNTLATQKNELKSNSNAFQQLGISTLDAHGKQKDFNTILFDVADKFKAMPDGIDKTALSMELFGRSGKDMVKVLNLGSAGIKDLEKQADKLGLTLTANTIEKVNKLVQSQKDLKAQTDALKISVGTATAPILTAFNQKINQLGNYLLAADSPFKQMTANVLAFGGPIATAGGAFAGFLGNISSAGPLLKGLVGFLANPIFLLFALIIGGITYEVMKLHKSLGSWHEVSRVLLDKVKDLAEAVGNYLMPKLTAFWHTIQTKLLPLMLRLWKEVIEPLIPVIGTVFVAAWGATIDILNIFLRVAAPVLRWLLDNKPAALGLAAAIGVLAFALNFSSIVTAFSANMAAVRAAFIATQATIAAPLIMPAIAVAAALASLALVYDAAQKIKGAVEAVNGAAAAAASAGRSNDDVIRRLQAQTRAPYSPAMQAQARKTLAGLAAGGSFASGGYTGSGGSSDIAGVVHKGEYVVPKNQVDQSTGKPKAAMAGNTSTVNIGTIVLSSPGAVTEFFKKLDQDTLNVGKGLTPNRGMY